MQRILITMDDVNYLSGAHNATFAIANYLKCMGKDVAILSECAIGTNASKKINSNVRVTKTANYSDYDVVVVPFENSKYRPVIAEIDGLLKIQWIHIDYAKWIQIVCRNIEDERKLFSKFDIIVFVAQQNMKGFLEIFPEFEEKCRVIYNFMDFEGIKELAEHSIDDEIFLKKEKQLNIVMAGRLEPQKGYHRMVDAAKILRDRGLNIKWYILGSGSEYEELRIRKEKYGLSNIHFLGKKKNPFPYFKKADILALLSDYEGLALVLAESFIVGTPVLTTRCGGAEELFDKNGGWIVDNNILPIVEKIEEVYENPADIEKKREYLSQYRYTNEGTENALKELFQIDKMEKKMVYAKEYMKNNSSECTDLKVSVIVPVYNMEVYLEECLESLVHQTLEELEVIIVNDGSTDNSQKIIDKYTYLYPERVRAFTIKNQGLGKARNYGIQKATGKYLGFVDSDDAVERNMYEILYREAIKNSADCVLCDYIATWPSGKTEYVTSVVGNSIDRFDILKYSAKYGVVNACTKLVEKKLFDHCLFPEGFYEDLATMPIILSYANKIHYVKMGLYYYRQRSGSITSIKKADERLFDCYKAWDRIIRESNPIFAKEMIFAVRWSINFFCTNFLSDFVQNSKSYYDKNRRIFEGNEYIEEAIKAGEFEDFDHYPEIPKIIHYCWFGENEKTDLIKKCIESWKKYAPDFKIIEWNETNCDINENEYVKEAYKQKKYAFVSDYFRFKALEEYGGVYMDTDMELMQDIRPYVLCSAFFAFETPIFVHAGIIGAMPHHKIIQSVLDGYKQSSFENGESGIPETSPMRITKVLEKDPLFVKNGKTQMISNHVEIYSANMMTMNFYDGNCIANHHYEGSWMNAGGMKKHLDNYGYQVMRHYFTWDLVEKMNANPTCSSIPGVINTFSNEECIAQLNYYKSECERLENTTCWKITKPIRIVGDFVKRIGKKRA